MTVAANVTLTIQAGTIVKFADRKLMSVKGMLKVQGTAGNPVYITSLHDDDVGGDTNNNGRVTLPAAGNWGHISFMDESVDSQNLIEHAVIRYGGFFANVRDEFYICWFCEYRGPIWLFTASPTIRNTTFAQNDGYGISASIDSFPTITAITFTQNVGNGLEIRGGTLGSNAAATHHWSNTAVVYAITGHLIIGSNDTLIIDPDIVVKFVDKKLMRVNGALRVQGTADNPVYITSLHDDDVGGDTNNNGRVTLPAAGNWGHISFMDESVDSQNLIEHAVIRYGGFFANVRDEFYICWFCEYRGPIWLFTASPTIRNTTFAQNDGYGISASIDSFPTITAITFTQNVGNGLEIRGGTLGSNAAATHHWSNTAVVYAITGHLIIGSNDTLIIDPDIVVKFVDKKLMRVNGALRVQGTADNPVYITSLHDDDVGGDTNNNGRVTLPAAGNWGHISFMDESVDSQNLIEHAVIRYGGFFANGRDDFYTCWFCEYRGPVWLFAASPTIRNNVMSNNDHGIAAWDGSAPTLDCNDIHNNSGKGIYSNTPAAIIIAENHWWGNASGPTHPSNPGGTGQAVGDGVDFTPWSISSCVSDPDPTTPVPDPTTPVPNPTTPVPPTDTPTPVPPPTDPPTLREIRPNQGRADVANTINLYGTNFAQGAAVRLGTTTLAVTYVSATQLQAEIPAGVVPGTYGVSVTNPNGAAATLANGYTALGTESDDLTGNGYELWVDPAAPHAGAAAKVGLVVHRQGGKQVLTNVVVHFYVGDPFDGGTFLGADTLALLSPRSNATGPGVNWVPPAAGSYELYAIIDPSNSIVETNETNNLLQRTITVLAPAADQVAPHVDSFTINNGALDTADRTVRLNTSASDPAPGTVASLLFLEYEYSQGANQWVPAQSSGWIDYATARADYRWSLLPSIGMHYLQAWAMDRAGNISLFPYKRFISFAPPIHRVGTDQVRIYRYELQAGAQILVRVQPSSGDPDLYVWSPDHATRPPWVSNLRTGIDDVSFVAPVAGVYQIEVYGFANAEYQLVVDHGNELTVAAQTTGGIDPEKSQPSQPRVPLNSLPTDKIALPGTEQSVRPLYLPLIRR